MVGRGKAVYTLMVTFPLTDYTVCGRALEQVEENLTAFLTGAAGGGVRSLTATECWLIFDMEDGDGWEAWARGLVAWLRAYGVPSGTTVTACCPDGDDGWRTVTFPVER